VPQPQLLGLVSNVVLQTKKVFLTFKVAVIASSLFVIFSLLGV
jgi:hypothetical protein